MDIMKAEALMDVVTHATNVLKHIVLPKYIPAQVTVIAAEALYMPLSIGILVILKVNVLGKPILILGEMLLIVRQLNVKPLYQAVLAAIVPDAHF